MELKTHPSVDVPSSLIDAIRSFPQEREVEHCGSKFVVSPFDIYATCPRCGTRLKVRSFSAVAEIEDLFDAVFEWLLQPGAKELAKRRQQAIESDRED
jgi:hypothetical protein